MCDSTYQKDRQKLNERASRTLRNFRDGKINRDAAAWELRQILAEEGNLERARQQELRDQIIWDSLGLYQS